MQLKRLWMWGALLLVFGAGVGILQAQATCPEIVDQALEQLDGFCSTLDRNTACYGYNLVEATFMTEAVPVSFAGPGDLAALTDLATLDTAPLNITDNVWGLSALKLQTVIPGTLPGQGVVFLLAGGTTLEDGGGTTPMQTFYFTAGIGAGNCNQAPDVLYVQGPQNVEVDIRANGADIRIGSTIALQGDEGGVRLVSLAGGATVICPGDTPDIFVPEGFFIENDDTIVLNEGANGQQDDVVILTCNWSDPQPLSPQAWRDLAGPLQGGKLTFLNYQLPANPPPSIVAQLPPCTVDTSKTAYIVSVGDTLTSIAAQFGTTTQQITLDNCLQNPDLISVGTTLYVDGVLPSIPTPTPIPAAPVTSGGGSSGGGGNTGGGGGGDTGGGEDTTAPPVTGTATLTVTAGNGQVIDLDQTFGTLSVQLLDENSAPVIADTITFTVTGGTGNFISNGTPSETATTDNAGNATSSGIVPACPTGPLTVVATSAAYPALSATFTLTSQNRQLVTGMNHTDPDGLINAINSACTTSPASIFFDGGVGMFSGNVPTLAINSNITIDGTGSSVLVSGNGANQIFNLQPAASLTLTNMSLIDGFINGFGGAINNSGVLTLNTVSILDSAADEGGAIYNGTGATLNMTNVTIGAVAQPNTAADAGGGIVNLGTLTANGGTFIGNTSSLNGGGLYNGGAATLTGVTLYGNTALDGGGIYNEGTLTLAGVSRIGDNATNFNTASNIGGGLYINAGTATLNGTFVGFNQAFNGGGGIINKATLNMTGVTVDGNSTVFGNGAGIFHGSLVPLTISGGQINNNVNADPSTGQGGALYAGDSNVTLVGVSISNNDAVNGSVAYLDGPQVVTFQNTVLQGNTSNGMFTFYCQRTAGLGTFVDGGGNSEVPDNPTDNTCGF